MLKELQLMLVPVDNMIGTIIQAKHFLLQFKQKEEIHIKYMSLRQERAGMDSLND